jgi:hypothetical protein
VIVIVILLFSLAMRVHADISHPISQNQLIARNDQSKPSKYIQIIHHTHFLSFSFPFLSFPLRDKALMSSHAVNSQPQRKALPGLHPLTHRPSQYPLHLQLHL